MARSKVRVGAGFAFAALVTLVVSCTLTQGIDDYGAGSGAVCTAGQKACGASCRSKTDPEVGCGAKTCTPCAFANAAPAGCTEVESCRMGACFQGFTDCNDDPIDGCEVNTNSDAKNCGGCGKACAQAPGAVAKCAAATCEIDRCAPGFGNCNTDEADGCEVALATDVKHCGTCAKACADPPRGKAACSSSACSVAAGSCDLGAQDCDGLFDNGCECAFPNALAQCGSAGLTDAGPDAADLDTRADAGADVGDGGDAPLDGGGGACTFGRCRAGFTHCAGDLATTGCETDTRNDADNCGRCGKKCDGGACVGGVCQPFVLAANQPSPGQIIFDGAWVYWTNYGASGAGSVAKVRVDGAELTTVAASQTNAWGVGELGTEVFWTTYATISGSTTANVVGRALKDGSQAGSPRTLASIAGRIRGIAVDPQSSYIYFGLYDAPNADAGASPSSGIYRVDRVAAGATPELFAPAQRPNAVLVDPTNVYWTNEGTLTPSSGSVAYAAKNAALPAPVTTLATGLSRPRGLALDADTVYWSNAGSSAAARDGSVEKRRKDGTDVKYTLASALSGSREVALDATYVYWASYRDHSVSRISKVAPASAQPEILAQNLPAPATPSVVNPLSVAVDAKYVYWSNYGGALVPGGPALPGAILRLVKP